MLLGNEQLVNDFKKLADNGRLSHAYLFFGEPQVGKFLFASSFANYLENKTFESPKIHPKETLIVEIREAPMLRLEASEVGVPTAKRVGNEEESIGIDAIRSLQYFLYRKPVFSPRRTIIIRDAEFLTSEAQNAILKIVEEPPAESLIIFIASSYDNLLPTVVSRLQKVYFPRIKTEEIAIFLKKNFRLSEAKAKSIADESFGRPGRAIQLIKNQEARIMNYELSEIVENNKIDEYFEALICDLHKEPVKNYKKLKQVLNRLTLMKQFNLNKKLQLKTLWSS